MANFKVLTLIDKARPDSRIFSISSRCSESGQVPASESDTDRYNQDRDDPDCAEKLLLHHQTLSVVPDLGCDKRSFLGTPHLAIPHPTNSSFLYAEAVIQKAISILYSGGNRIFGFDCVSCFIKAKAQKRHGSVVV